MTDDERNTTWTGFLEFAPRDKKAQSRFSALSPTWEGIESSEKAVASGVFDLDKAEAARRELREELGAPKGEVPITFQVKEKPSAVKQEESAWDSPTSFFRYLRTSLGYE